MRIDPDGIDLDWFALDQDGHVGVFSSGGSRVVPESVLASNETLKSMGRTIEALPSIGRGRGRLFVSGDRSHWKAMAARGLFAYDFKSHDANHFEKGDYELIAVPSRPVTADSLDGSIRETLRPLTLNTICFAKTRLVKQALIRSL